MELKDIIVPQYFINLIRYIRYKQRYPHCNISPKATIRFDLGRIGEKCEIYENVNIGVHSFNIGDYSVISGPTQIVGLGEVTIGKYCSIAPDVYMVTNNHNYNNILTYPLDFFGIENIDSHLINPIVIGNDVWIGRGVTILPGAIIQDGCVIAAGSIVPKGIYDSYSIIGGNPAKVIKKRFNENLLDDILKQKIFEKNNEEFMEFIKRYYKL